MKVLTLTDSSDNFYSFIIHKQLPMKIKLPNKKNLAMELKKTKRKLNLH